MDDNMYHKYVEEGLREAAASGNEDALLTMLGKGVNLNAQNAMNGWTALHWACKRSHRNIVKLLLQEGADAAVVTHNGETCLDLASDSQIRILLGGSADGYVEKAENGLPIIPNYVANPIFPYAGADNSRNSLSQTAGHQVSNLTALRSNEDELVLKVRLANVQDRDFIEIELPRSSLTFEHLVATMCSELDADRSLVHRVRKLPDTIVRKDKDVSRLRDFQELELVLVSRASNDVFHGYKAAVNPKHIDVIY